jgi:hypothetical protein
MLPIILKSSDENKSQKTRRFQVGNLWQFHSYRTINVSYANKNQWKFYEWANTTGFIIHNTTIISFLQESYFLTKRITKLLKTFSNWQLSIDSDTQAFIQSNSFPIPSLFKVLNPINKAQLTTAKIITSIILIEQRRTEPGNISCITLLFHVFACLCCFSSSCSDFNALISTYNFLLDE